MDKYYGYILAIILVAICCMIPENRLDQSSKNFPSPDPEKGWATGFNYDKGDYEYHTDYDGTKWKPGMPIKKQGKQIRQVKKTTSKEDILMNKIYEMDIQDLLDYAY